ncbi:MAG TPA: hypothetical protein VND65_21500 [Candidatus Binatia bacterium]|nr:hypothetical protein [Candidatus Binatia bacterium]
MRQQVQLGETAVPPNQRAEAEIRSFLRALQSYPARAAKEPGVSFEQHLATFFNSPTGAGRSTPAASRTKPNGWRAE